MTSTTDDKLDAILQVLSQQKTSFEIDRENIRLELKALSEKMPFDHLPQHDLLRNHLAMSPEPKLHGEHHNFTHSFQTRVSDLVGYLVKGVAAVILALLLLGLGTWVSNNYDSPSRASIGAI